jgi:hypothetical protein
VFDAARTIKTLKLPAPKDFPKVKLRCAYYAHFMVKQVDEGEVGAAQLSFVPITGAAPPCQRANLDTEKVIDPKDWSGYFKGVKGDYGLFDADDGVNGALGFAVFDVEAHKVFEDAASGSFREASIDGRTLTLRYKRSFSGDCSVVKGAVPCWSKIATATGVAAAPPPDCAAGYAKAKREMAKGRCDADRDHTPACISRELRTLDAQRWDEAPSVIVYEARTVIEAGHATTTALGPAESCHPSD